MSSLLQELPPSVRPASSAAEVTVPLIAGPQRDLLCTLSYIYLACGQPDRALALLRLVERDVENDIGFLRVLAYALIAAEDGLEAIRVIERLQELDGSANARAPLLLMRSHALRLTGHLGEARECFRAFTAARRQAEGDAS
ncbi:histidine kinase [Bradyrhizobium sp. Arg237L]|uniref:type III secretion apparatus assembly chaperone SctY n=1 Tax=Bradyrhizobium sp. Arg237L TaxID=3003352 RepID=UPI00249E0D59|nr:histidine kinase [Bradyrhizobium sp. Arg237L]MDI4231940.1 histidine kinase [Bradyrhizobium sp. Arg237L]